MPNANAGFFSPYVKNPYLTQKKVYRTIDLLATCKGNDLNIITFKYLTGKFSKKYVQFRLLTADMRYPIICLLYTSPSPRDVEESRMPSSA